MDASGAGTTNGTVVVIIASSGMAHHTETADRLFKEAPNVRRYTTLFVLGPVRTGSALPTRARFGHCPRGGAGVAADSTG